MSPLFWEAGSLSKHGVNAVGQHAAQVVEVGSPVRSEVRSWGHSGIQVDALPRRQSAAAISFQVQLQEGKRNTAGKGEATFATNILCNLR